MAHKICSHKSHEAKSKSIAILFFDDIWMYCGRTNYWWSSVMVFSPNGRASIILAAAGNCCYSTAYRSSMRHAPPKNNEWNNVGAGIFLACYCSSHFNFAEYHWFVGILQRNKTRYLLNRIGGNFVYGTLGTALKMLFSQKSCFRN